jgi:RNA polymerase sigma-70 factor, ECF subfamily
VRAPCPGPAEARRHFAARWPADRPAGEALLDSLAVAAAAGDREARSALLAIIHDHHLARPAVTRVLIDAADIDDALQLSLIGVAERIGSYGGQGAFLAWLGRLARNEALMVVRRRQRRSEPSGDEPPEQWGTVARLSSFVADADAVRRLIDGLPAAQRDVVRLREVEGLGYDEIAAHLRLPVGTVRSRLARAREQLARQARAW